MRIRAYLIGGRVLEREVPADPPRFEVELPGEDKRRVLRRTKDTADGAIIYREVTP